MMAARTVLLLSLLPPAAAGPGSIPGAAGAGADAGVVDLPPDPSPTEIAEIMEPETRRHVTDSTTSTSTSTSTEAPGRVAAARSSTSSSSTTSSTTTSTDAPGEGDSWNYYGRNGGGNNRNGDRNLEKEGVSGSEPDDSDNNIMVIVLAVVFALATTGLVVYGVTKHFQEQQRSLRTLISFAKTSSAGTSVTEARAQQFAGAFEGGGGLHDDAETASHAESSLYDAEALYLREHGLENLETAAQSSRIASAAGAAHHAYVPLALPGDGSEAKNPEHTPRLSECPLTAADHECLDLGDCDADSEA